jgi:hypothetical protein
MMAVTTKKITAKKASESDALLDESFSQRKRPAEAQFRVQVDRQTKSSHATLAQAEAAASAIKNAYPVVQVSIYDAQAGQTTLVEVDAE